MRRLRWWAPRLALSLGAMVATCAVLEVGGRAWKRATAGPTTHPDFVTWDAQTGWQLRPNAHLHHRTGEFDVVARTNASGYRDDPFDFDAPPADSVVLLGDSYTFGWGVARDDTFAQRLERSTGRSVHNLGVGGTTADQQLLVLEQTGMALKPSWVVVTFCANDLSECLARWSYGQPKPRALIDADDTLILEPPPSLSWCDRRLLLARWVRFHWDVARRPPFESQRPHAWRVLLRTYQSMERTAQGAGARFLVAVEEEPHARRIEEAGFSVLHLGPALDAATATGPIRFPQDGHWNARGHAVVAAALAERLDADD